MKRQELLLNLTLVIVIAALIYLIYESKDLPRGLDELDVAPVAAQDDSTTGSSSRRDRRPDQPGDRRTTGAGAPGEDAAPGSETSYAAGATTGTETSDGQTTGIAGAAPTPDRVGEFGRRNIFRALLTPTPTPPPPTPTPAPTPNITTALGAWRLLSVYNGKAMMEDVRASEAGAEGAIWEMAQGETKQVDVGGGIMKTATLKTIDNANPYNPEVVFTLEDTTTERKINLDTEPVTGAPAAK